MRSFPFTRTKTLVLLRNSTICWSPQAAPSDPNRGTSDNSARNGGCLTLLRTACRTGRNRQQNVLRLNAVQEGPSATAKTHQTYGKACDEIDHIEYNVGIDFFEQLGRDEKGYQARDRTRCGNRR